MQAVKEPNADLLSWCCLVFLVHPCVYMYRSGIGGLIQATVTTLPSITVPVVVKSDPHPAVTRPSHTSPEPGFGRKVGGVHWWKFMHRYGFKIHCSCSAAVTVFVL